MERRLRDGRARELWLDERRASRDERRARALRKLAQTTATAAAARRWTRKSMSGSRRDARRAVCSFAYILNATCNWRSSAATGNTPPNCARASMQPTAAAAAFEDATRPFDASKRVVGARRCAPLRVVKAPAAACRLPISLIKLAHERVPKLRRARCGHLERAPSPPRATFFIVLPTLTPERPRA